MNVMGQAEEADRAGGRSTYVIGLLLNVLLAALGVALLRWGVNYIAIGAVVLAAIVVWRRLAKL